MGIPRRLADKFSNLYQIVKTGAIPNFDELYQYCKDNDLKTTVRTDILFGQLLHKENGVLTDEFSKKYDKRKYKFFLDAPFEISGGCCRIMKKQPIHEYDKKTGRVAMTGQMADESELRRSNWIKYGCNGFDMKKPISNPLSFWTEQDILEYIVKYDVEICSVYGDIAEDFGDQLDGQMHLADYGLAEKQRKYKCTGCKRTGCVLCSFGAHLESKEESRFCKLHESHPKLYGLLDVIQNSGVTYREAIEWYNANVDDKSKIWL